jgi:type IV pilus assembly protein PilX
MTNSSMRVGRRGARGVTLVVVMLFMLALTAVVLFSARSALLGEALARNQLDEQTARQAAEAALRDAEKDLLLPGGVTPTGAVCDRGPLRPVVNTTGLFDRDCTGGQCAFLQNDVVKTFNYGTVTDEHPEVAEAWWPVKKGGRWNNDADSQPKAGSTGACGTFTGGVPLGTFTGMPRLAGVARQPEYLLELIRSGSGELFRVTARGFGVRGNTEIVLQTYVQKPEL